MSSAAAARLDCMTEIAAEIRAGCHDGTAGLAVWLERDYDASLTRVADALPQAWADDGHCLTLDPLGCGCVVRVDVAVGDIGEAAAVIDGWSARLEGLAEDVARPGQLALLPRAA